MAVEEQRGTRARKTPRWKSAPQAYGSTRSFAGPHAPKKAYNAFMATTSYLDRLLEPLTAALTPEMACVLLELRADSEMEARIGELRRKANSGTLTPAEDAEYKDFVEAVDLISIMQAKARRFLAKQSA